MIFLRHFIEKLKKHYLSFYGILIGAASGLFGGGGGMIAVPILEKSGLEQKKAHATSIAVTSILSLISVIIYIFKGGLKISYALPYIPLGLVGAAAGGFILKKIPDKKLKKFFGFVMIFSGIKLIAG